MPRFFLWIALIGVWNACSLPNTEVKKNEVLSISDWTYIPIDSTKQKWGDWDDPDWLRYFGLDICDVNQDGFQDIVSGRYVYHNPKGQMEGIWKRTVLDDNIDAILSLDIDDDSFADIIAQALPDVYWYEAVNKEGTQYNRKKIASIPATSHVNSQGFKKTQIIAGGKEEILIAGNGNVYCITIPKQTETDQLWDAQLIAANTSDEGIGVGDIDQDGDLDIACGRRPEGYGEPKILVWFENPNHIDQPWKNYEIGKTEHPIDRIQIADLNGDQQSEIILVEERYPGLEPDCHLFCFSKKDDLKSEWKKTLIAKQYSSNNLDVADIDNDGDIDILTGEHKGPKLELQLWENDGQANFSKRILDTGKENHLGTKLFDLDDDGDLDIIGAAWDNYRWMHVWRNDAIQSKGISLMENNTKESFHSRKTSYQGQDHFVITTNRITYYYDIQGGGFSRIIDEYGNDWVAFEREPWGEYPASAASSFRGIPNLLWQGDEDGAGHPGHQKCRSWQEGETIFSETLNKKWKWSWTFYDDYVELKILEFDPNRKYWFLYEGTPGGKYNPQETYFGTSNAGPLQETPDYFKNEFETNQFQWIYSGTKKLNAVFFMVHLQKDKEEDMIAYLGNKDGVNSKDGMTVWAFGRNKKPQSLLSGQNDFVIGFYPNAIRNQEEHRQFEKFISSKFLKEN